MPDRKIDRGIVITHLLIIKMWTEFARERGLQFFTVKHLQDIAKWSDDAIAMLKEQEAKLPRKITTIGELMNGICPNPLCNAEINSVSNGMACGYCGQAVKWE